MYINVTVLDEHWYVINRLILQGSQVESLLNGRNEQVLSFFAVQ